VYRSSRTPRSWLGRSASKGADAWVRRGPGAASITRSSSAFTERTGALGDTGPVGNHRGQGMRGAITVGTGLSAHRLMTTRASWLRCYRCLRGTSRCAFPRPPKGRLPDGEAAPVRETHEDAATLVDASPVALKRQCCRRRLVRPPPQAEPPARAQAPGPPRWSSPDGREGLCVEDLIGDLVEVRSVALRKHPSTGMPHVRRGTFCLTPPLGSTRSQGVCRSRVCCSTGAHQSEGTASPWVVSRCSYTDSG
jgi:hypothetical protein